jgi:hypothetical protein
MLMLAMFLAAATPQKPWIEMSAGPMFLHQSGRPGLGTGPLVRLELGRPLGERVAAELWVSGILETAPLGVPGDHALLGAGVGLRYLLLHLDSEDKLNLWAHGGAGWGAPVAGEGSNGPAAFAGALLAFQPFVSRFSMGLEANALAWRSKVGVALTPSIRCTF